MLWSPDSTIWIPTYYQYWEQHEITFYNTEDGAVNGKILLDPEPYVYAVYFSGLQFELGGNDLAVARYSAGVSDILVYDIDTMEETIVDEERVTGSAPITFRWLDQGRLNYCINPNVDGPEGSPESESITYNLETGYKMNLPFCVDYISPDGKYTINLEWWDSERNDFIYDLNVIEISTGDVIDSLDLSSIEGIDLDNFFEEGCMDWGMGGIIIWRAISPTIWQPELPD